MVSIEGLDKADVLAALYNGSRAQGMAFLQYEDRPMTKKEAEELLKRSDYFDYLKGRVMKVSLRGDKELNEFLYDRDNGPGAAEQAINSLRVKSQVA